MSSYFDYRPSKNEFTNSIDTTCAAIQLKSGHHILRKFTDDNTWNEILILWRMSTLNCPSTDVNMTGCYFFFGICSDNKYFSQNPTNSHAVGVVPTNSTSSVTLSNVTNTLTDPAGRVNYTSMTMVPIVQSGSAVPSRSTGFNVGSISAKRLETSWTSSLTSSSFYGNTWIPCGISITKASNGGWTVRGLTTSTSGTNVVTSSINISNACYKLHDLFENTWANARNVRVMERFWNDIFNKPTDINIFSTVGTTFPANSVDENTYGYLNTLQFYWKNTEYPNMSLLIKDLRIYMVC